ncbi:Protein LAZ1 [Vitis vinifera]|uniref:Protein LAZ1 n=1 Tax=Vitis vinifera TaxID=29760 RepID=A0A438JU16_VITVI|nr:Protein LAZ1 [Vitis vinifera]
MKLTGFLDINPLGSSTPTWASLVAGVFVLISLSLSMYLLFEHLSSYKNPEVLLHHNYNFIVLSKSFLIGVILMVPCYAIESFVSLVNPSISVDCAILRDCYEAFAMYCFGRYLVACLGKPL